MTQRRRLHHRAGRALPATLVALLPLALAACTLSVGTTPPAGPTATSTASLPSLPPEQVAQAIDEKLTAEVGQRPKKVECPGPLPGVPGATLRCVLTAEDDSTVGVTATVTTVGQPGPGTVNYDIAADTTVTPAPAPPPGG